jgi:hypothetical protein
MGASRPAGAATGRSASIGAVSPTQFDDPLLRAALRALSKAGKRVGAIDEEAAGHPGLYAICASAATWRELDLGQPPDNRPLYIGKAEDSLASRDLRGHFGMRERKKPSPTGSSTLRRSFAALLADSRGYRGMPRNPENPSHFSNYGLSVADDEDLSAWMRRSLRIALWPHDDSAALDAIETAALKRLLPPLNLNKVVTPWKKEVKDARVVLTDQAREWHAARGSRHPPAGRRARRG